jgi:PHD/YefM family antitoxin component YafN of YafNO toxin-antitoxin module
MQFVTAQDFKFASRKTRRQLAEDGKLVITEKGKPAALILDLKNTDLERTLNDLQKIEGMRLLERFWERNADREPLSDEEINAEIQAARAEMKAKSSAR